MRRGDSSLVVAPAGRAWATRLAELHGVEAAPSPLSQSNWIAIRKGGPPTRPVNLTVHVCSRSTRDRRSSVKMLEDAERVGAQFGHKSFATRYRARKLLILNGEMLERSIRHAWKTIPARLTESYGNTSSRNRLNDFPPQNPSRCEPVNARVCRRFRSGLTQFLHSSRHHLFQYAAMFFRVCSSVCVDTDGFRNCRAEGHEVPAEHLLIERASG
jgi:hypothetical protein